MRKLTFVTAFFMVLMLASAGMATADQQKPIQVWLDGEELVFEVQPVLHNNITYVEFRSLFTALDFKITYEATTKRIRGTSIYDNVTIEMTIGSDKAFINGQPAKGNVQPIVRDGRTLVPLRFVGEATELDVQWDAKDRSITLTTPGPTAQDYEQIISFLTKLGEAQSNGNEAEVRALLNSGSPLYESNYSALMEFLNQVKIKSEYELSFISNMTNTSTMIMVNNESTKISDGFYIDNKSFQALALSRDNKGGDWKLDSLLALITEYTNAEEVLASEPTVPAEEKAKIIALLEEQINSSNDNDNQRYAATFDPNIPGLEESLAFLDVLMAEYNLHYELNDWKIVYYDELQAYVYFSQTTTRIDGPEYADNRMEGILKVIKLEDGTWRVTNTSFTLSIEEL